MYGSEIACYLVAGTLQGLQGGAWLSRFICVQVRVRGGEEWSATISDSAVRGGDGCHT